MEPMDYVAGYRFDGFNTLMLASETDWAREGIGAQSMLDAHDALREIGSVLAGTDSALRDELSRLGVVWESESGRAAARSVGGNADFAETAAAKVDRAAEGVWMMGQAFTTLLHNLPDAQTLRDGAHGLSTGDMLAGLIGHETDHAAAVRASAAARNQAVDALNGFQETCFAELSAIAALPEPPGFVVDTGPVAPSDGLAVTPISSTQAPADCPPVVPAGQTGAVPVAPGSTGGSGPEAGTPAGPEAPADPEPAREDCGPGQDDPAVVDERPAYGAVAADDIAEADQLAEPGEPVGEPLPLAADRAEASAQPGPVSAPPAADAPVGPLPDAAGSSRADALARGSVTGVVAPPPTSAPELAPAASAALPAGMDGGAAGLGAAALVAAGIAGAVSGADDRGRGVRGITNEDLAGGAPDPDAPDPDDDPGDD